MACACNKNKAKNKAKNNKNSQAAIVALVLQNEALKRAQAENAFRENVVALGNLGIDTCFFTNCPKGLVCLAGFCVSPIG